MRKHDRLEWEGEGFEGKEEQNDGLRQLLGVLGHAENIHRFGDRRQHPFEGKPLPDGSNICVQIEREDGTYMLNGSPWLRFTFYLYRDWLEYLYLDHLAVIHAEPIPNTNDFDFWIDYDTDRTNTLPNILTPTLAAIANGEKNRVPELDRKKQYETEKSLDWILIWRMNLANAVHDMAAAGTWAGIGTYEEEDEMAEVLVLIVSMFLPKILIHGQIYDTLPYVETTLVSILYKEELFEKRLRALHVEDEHILKRMRLLSTEMTGKLGKGTMDSLNRKYFDKVKAQTAPFQEGLRSLFHFRQLRDWGCVEPSSLYSAD